MKIALIFFLLTLNLMAREAGTGTPTTGVINWRVVQTVGADSGNVELSEASNDTNLVFVVSEPGAVPAVSDSMGNVYTLSASSGQLFAYVATGIKGGLTTVSVQNARAISVTEVAGVSHAAGNSTSGTGFSATGHVSATVPSIVLWALDVTSHGSWPVRYIGDGVVESRLFGKVLIGVNAINPGTYPVTVQITSENAAGGNYSMALMVLN
jgi:hypothetical protein